MDLEPVPRADHEWRLHVLDVLGLHLIDRDQLYAIDRHG